MVDYLLLLTNDFSPENRNQIWGNIENMVLQGQLKLPICHGFLDEDWHYFLKEKEEQAAIKTLKEQNLMKISLGPSPTWFLRVQVLDKLLIQPHENPRPEIKNFLNKHNLIHIFYKK